MGRVSNGVIGVVNFVTFLVSIPILGGAIWLSTRAATTECLRFLQWPLLGIGVALMVVSLAGFAGACYRLPWLLRLYLFSMFLIVAALVFFVIFAFAVTDRGHGQVVLNRAFLEYQLSDYSGWLRDRVSDPAYWARISSCLRDSRACKHMARYVRDPNTGLLLPETQDMFSQRDLSPIEVHVVFNCIGRFRLMELLDWLFFRWYHHIYDDCNEEEDLSQSGCCKPPTSCGYTYVNETLWNQEAGMVVTDRDCMQWSNDQQVLCFQCDSCKAGVLASIRHSWRKVSVINIVVLVLIVIFYVVGCAAYRNAKMVENDESFGMARMTKAQPSRFQF